MSTRDLEELVARVLELSASDRIDDDEDDDWPDDLLDESRAVDVIEAIAALEATDSDTREPSDEDDDGGVLDETSHARALRVRKRRRRRGERWKDWLDGNDVRVSHIVDTSTEVPDFRALQGLVSANNALRAVGTRHADNVVTQPDPWSVVFDLKRAWRKRTHRWYLCDQNPNDTRGTGKRRLLRVWSWETLQDVRDRIQAREVGGETIEELALITLGSYSLQTVGGPLSVGTHGSGMSLASMSDYVAEVDILGPDGQVRRVCKARSRFSGHVTLPAGLGAYKVATTIVDPDVFRAAVVNLGTWGIVLSYAMEVRLPYWVKQTVRTTEWRTAFQMIRDEDLLSCYQHVEMLVVCEEDVGEGNTALILREHAPEPDEPIPAKPFPACAKAIQGKPQLLRTVSALLRAKKLRRNVLKGVIKQQAENDGQYHSWDEVLVRNSGIAAHGFEVAVPAESAERVVAVVQRIWREMLRSKTNFPSAPVSVRFVAAGEQYLAMNSRRVAYHSSTGARGIIRDVPHWAFLEMGRLLGTPDWDELPRRVLAELSRMGVPARPHWGQYFPAESMDAAALYPELPKWHQARRVFEADRRFMTSTIATLLHAPGSRQTGAAALSISDAALRARSASPAWAVELPAASSKLVLCVHGIGRHEMDGEWTREWATALETALAGAGCPPPKLVFIGLDDIFADYPLSAAQFSEAMRFFATNWLGYHGSRSSTRGVLDSAEDWFEWTPGMIAEWASNDELRARVRERVLSAIEAYAPDVVVAHSLGSLAAYDALSRVDAEQSPAKEAHLITIGSQIGHPAIGFRWAGRVPMPSVGAWTNIHNRADPVFSRPIRVAHSRFQNIDVRRFEGKPGLEQHAAAAYLSSGHLAAEVWRTILSDADFRRGFPSVLRETAHRPAKALLVGINEYANPRLNLEGCVNDVFLASEVLQERFGYDPNQVRLLTDRRATAANIRERLEWLLGDVREDDRRVLYFSGHGARIPAYDALEEIDGEDECLVSHDFDWNDLSTAILDDEFLELYSGLPYSSRFVTVFDCCHSGGMARAGGVNVRGLTPPDDVRHRLMAARGGRWLPRFERQRYDLRGDHRVGSFLGSASRLRPRSSREFQEIRQAMGHAGPYLPILLYACSESEFAYEYRDGSRPHGAFTYALMKWIRENPDADATFAEAVRAARREVQDLGFSQTPSLEISSAFARASFRF